MPGPTATHKPPPKKGWLQRLVASVTKDSVLYLMGLFLIWQESQRTGPTRPEFLILYAGMVGLSPILRAQKKRNAEDDE